MELSSNLEIERYHPYDGKCSGVGRWFEACLETGEKFGFVWTNDKDGFGVLTTETIYDSQEYVDWFLHCQKIWGENDTPTSDAFNSFYRMQASWASEDVTIVSGDLYNTLLHRAEKYMDEDEMSYVEFGVTTNDSGDVLEFVRVDGTGLYYREGSEWVEVDPESTEDDYPTIFNQAWTRVSEDLEDLFDSNVAFTLADIGIYIL